MIRVSSEYQRMYKEAAKNALKNPDDEDLKAFVALDTLVKEIEKNGFENMIDLDPYFGETSLPFKEHTDLLASKYPEEFSFFKDFMDDLQEEIELHFEVTEMYEDEEFDQFVEDLRIIKRRYTEIFNSDYGERMSRFVARLLEDINQEAL